MIKTIWFVSYLLTVFKTASPDPHGTRSTVR